MCGIVCIIQDITAWLFDLTPPFGGHHTHYIRHRVYCICVITPTLSMISQPIYVWYHIQYMWDILSTIFMTSYPLCMTTQPCVLITPHSAHVWYHLHYRKHHIHSITPSHNLYDFTSTSGKPSHTLYQTSHQLYLCHHNLSTDITPTFFLPFLFFFFFYLWWILSYIEMKQPWVYMCFPSRSPLLLPSPHAPSRFSQCTRSEHLSHASNLSWWSVSP